MFAKSALYNLQARENKSEKETFYFIKIYQVKIITMLIHYSKNIGYLLFQCPLNKCQ